MKVLITGGGTQEPIDQARVISNVSTGRTAATLADEFTKAGASVTYVHGLTAQLPQFPCEQVPFSSHASLEKTLTQLLNEQAYTAVIHLAAVSDYTVESIQVGTQHYCSSLNGKLGSGEKAILTLIPTRKIIHNLKPQARFADFHLIGFKLTGTLCPQDRLQAIAKLTNNPDIDLIVHNDLNEITPHSHRFTIFQQTTALVELTGATALGQWLVKRVTSL
jgi:phosphopantothenoylcysteine synthetase/decarboxylase